MRKFAPVLALCLVSVAPVLVAHAQPSAVTYKACERQPTKDETSAARGLFQAGATSYNEADYTKAIQYWRDAFDRDCTANALLTNLANAYEKSGNIDGAIVSLETYLKRVPNDQDAPTIQRRIENMRKARDAAAATAKPVATETAKPAQTTAPVREAPVEPPPVESSPSKGPGIAPWIVTGVGGALLVAGGVVYLGGNSKLSDAEEVCPDRNKCTDPKARDQGNSGRSQITTGGVLMGVGAAGVVGGLAWYFLAKDKAPQSTAAPSRYLLPETGPGYAGATFGGTF